MPTTSRVASVAERTRIAVESAKAKDEGNPRAELQAIVARDSVMRRDCFQGLARLIGAWESCLREVGVSRRG